jgi:subtilisin family serine protease
MPVARRFFWILSLCILATFVNHGTDARSELRDASRAKVWVFFSDHGETGKAELHDMLASAKIDERALSRRARRSRSAAPAIYDLPVYQSYVDALRTLGAEIRRESRYFNAVSAWVTPEQLRAVSELPFVSFTDRVRTGRRRVPATSRRGSETMNTVPRMDGDLDYGFSEPQHLMINTIPLHAEGLTGGGIRIAVFDTGFFLDHKGLAHLDIVAEWDFINDDGVTADQYNDVEGQMWHGTHSLGIVASNFPGSTMGTAWSAEFILGKTERLLDEIESEEDDYIAALEWADGLGVDVVSSSLGYFYWYTQDEMDGDTALITRAVDIAASRGILVVTAAGNEGNSSWGTIIAPADADSAIAVGAVDPDGILKGYSSRGPTADGRIKPDVVAQGHLVTTLNWQDASAIAAAGGTSAATPLVAGAAALILQKHPDWSPIQVRDALRATASRTDTPGNDYGWGIIDAYAAAYHSATASIDIDIRPGACDNPFNPKSRGVLPVLLLGSDDINVCDIDIATLLLAGAGAAHARVADMSGGTDCASQAPDGHDDLLIKFRSEEIAAPTTSSKGDIVTLGLTGQLVDGTTIGGQADVRIVGNQGGPVLTETIRATKPTGLGAAVPNPFNPVTRIQYHVAANTHVELSIYDVRGRRVATLVDAVRPTGEHTATWNASARSSGVYFYRLSSDGIEETRKLILLK